MKDVRPMEGLGAHYIDCRHCHCTQYRCSSTQNFLIAWGVRRLEPVCSPVPDALNDLSQGAKSALWITFPQLPNLTHFSFGSLGVKSLMWAGEDRLKWWLKIQQNINTRVKQYFVNYSCVYLIKNGNKSPVLVGFGPSVCCLHHCYPRDIDGLVIREFVA